MEDLLEEENGIKERYELAFERIRLFENGDTAIGSPFFDYFHMTAQIGRAHV